MLKRCGKCLTEKRPIFFAKDVKKEDGLQGWCRDCQREYMREYHADRDRFRKEAAPEDPAKKSARNAVYYALQTGRLTRPAHCDECGSAGEVEAHHDDYENKLDVEWLCRACHSRHHTEVAVGLPARQM